MNVNKKRYYVVQPREERRKIIGDNKFTVI